MKIFNWLVPSWLVYVAALSLLPIGAVGGWVAQGWRKDAQIASLGQQKADDRASIAEGSLTKLNAAIAQMSGSAAEYIAVRDKLGVQLGVISKDLKNVQANKPLPVDCRPDADRLRSLAAAVDAANRAAAGQ